MTLRENCKGESFLEFNQNFINVFSFEIIGRTDNNECPNLIKYKNSKSVSGSSTHVIRESIHRQWIKEGF